jgi:hypothetical protein
MDTARAAPLMHRHMSIDERLFTHTKMLFTHFVGNHVVVQNKTEPRP